MLLIIYVDIKISVIGIYDEERREERWGAILYRTGVLA
jgi:hypothetical protein